jgi:hypothetical protein
LGVFGAVGVTLWCQCLFTSQDGLRDSSSPFSGSFSVGHDIDFTAIVE